MTDDTKKLLDDLETKRKEVLIQFDQWIDKYPNFKEIARIMNLYNTSDILIEFKKKSIPESILKPALSVFKKTISFKVSISDKKLMDGLTNSRYRHYKYCINKELAHRFQDDFLDWSIEISSLWHEAYYPTQDFFYNKGYDRTSWETYIKHPTMLEQKKNEIEKQSNNAIKLMESGLDLVRKYDQIISEEYQINGFEMSLYEREIEITQIANLDNENDEQYCYVYTLECELFVFYVGIASNPNERFEQHLRGAYSDETHLFKSKFIQKYHNEVKQKLIFEGTRRECKKFEIEYIAEHRPLGNMTEGGEG